MMPLTSNTPKPLLPVMDKPLLQYHIENLRKADITQIVINHCYLGEQIEDYFKDGRHLGVNIQWSAEEHALETAGGIKQALPLLGNDPFLVINSDIWTDISFEKWTHSPQIEQLHLKNRLAHLVLVPNPEQNTGGDFALENNLVLNKAQDMWTFSGVSLLSPALFQACDTQKPQGLAPLLRKAADRKLVSGEIYQGHWQDIGTPERLNQLELQLKNSHQSDSQAKSADT